MIARLKGTLAVKQPDHLVIEVGGVGYRVFTPLSTYYDLPPDGRPVELTIHTHVSSEAINLYGFASESEKQLFELLLAVSGIGPRLALNILSGIQAPDLAQALAQSDRGRLQAIPGVGKKTAERMIVELSEKAVGLAWVREAGPLPEVSEEEGLKADALSALANLGYNRQQAERVVEAVLAGMDGQPRLEELLKEVLRHLAR